MNIFAVDYCPRKSAESLVDKHVVKMIVESAQILSTVHHRHNTWHSELYKPTHINHPCVKWAAMTPSNYNWTYAHFCYLLDEYSYRYDKFGHKSLRLKMPLSAAPVNMAPGTLTPFALAMPDEYKVDDPVESYRNYYSHAKKSLHKWTLRNKPSWIN